MNPTLTVAAVLLVTAMKSLSAAEGPIGAEAAARLPIADMHFHVMPWMNVNEVTGYMDRNGIRWAGGAAALGGPARNAEVSKVMGRRFIRATGQGQWLGLKQSGGEAALQDADTAAFKQALAAIESALADPLVKVVGEIHVNTLNSAANTTVLHKVNADAPTLKAMFALAGKYGKPMNIHAQWDTDTAQQVAALAASSPAAKLIVSHCGSTGSAADMRPVLAHNANVSCDLSFRSPPQVGAKLAGRAAFDRTGVRGDWKALIEEFPDRFMVGLDDQHDWANYQETVKNIRAMLAELSPATAEKVAYKNAQAMFGLE